MADRPTFELGLTMAGAVSAGAYTAGVIDFLFEALDAIEDVRAGRPTDYLTAKRADGTPWPDAKQVIDPPHDVRIRAMSGTSAGSMVTAIVTTVLGTRIPPVTAERTATQTSATKNPLYDAWVQEIHYDKLLSTGDLAEGKHVLSVLNSEPLAGIVKDTLRYAEKSDYLRPYVTDPIQIFFCTGNLRGVRYSLDLNAGGDVPTEYQMSMHADWLGFQWSKETKPPQPGAMPLSPKAAPADWKALGDTALASGAFPIGLSARALVRDFADYEKRKWYNAYADVSDEFPPLDNRAAFKDGQYQFVNADGGIFNNEPLELCRVALSGSESARNPREADKATRAVILIDPFPNLFELDKDYAPDTHRELLDVVQKLFGAMISQARFKIDELALAKAPNVASRYAIMPSRYQDGQRQTHAIACGSLGGFGGFLSKAFRHHDFMLGRRNCQKFLADHFALPAGKADDNLNPLFAQWPDDLREAFKVEGGDDPGYRFAGVLHLPIVPLLGKLASPEYTRTPPWPVEPQDLTRADLKDKIIARADALKSSLIAQYQPSSVLQAGVSSYWWWKKKDWVDRFAIQKVAKALDERGIRFS
jgi:hypothetical protein